VNLTREKLGESIIEFKERTQISYVIIIPVMCDMMARLSVQCKGREEARRGLEMAVAAFNRESTRPAGSIPFQMTPQSPDQTLAVTNFLWEFVQRANAIGVKPQVLCAAFLLCFDLAEKARR